MIYNKTVRLKDGRECCLRNGEESDAQAVIDNFNLTHAQTDYLLSYPDESGLDLQQEIDFLRKKKESTDEAEILALTDGKVAATAGINRVGSRYKVRHRAELGISVDEKYWNLGIGRALLKACVECALKAGYEQLELEAVAENERAIALYKSEGFEEYGRNPKGFLSRYSGFQELVYMRLDLQKIKNNNIKDEKI